MSDANKHSYIIKMQNPFAVVDRRPAYGVNMVRIDHRARSVLPEFSHYNGDSLLTLAAKEALVQHAHDKQRGIVDRDGGLTFFYNGMGQLPPAQGHGDSWWPGTASGGPTTRPQSRGSNPINRRTTNISHTYAGAGRLRSYLATVPSPYATFSPC